MCIETPGDLGDWYFTCIVAVINNEGCYKNIPLILHSLEHSLGSGKTRLSFRISKVYPII